MKLKALKKHAQDHKDDSLIKCICGFQHDDGNSVFCEKCSTWQHTECYYYMSGQDRVPSDAELEAITHLCADCYPRSLDIQAATVRQHIRAEELNHDDSATRKSQTKTQRRKHRLPEMELNASAQWPDNAQIYYDHPMRSPSMLSSHKRSKQNSTSSNSWLVTSVASRGTSPGKKAIAPSQSLADLGSQQRSDILTGPYSPDFVRLYDGDVGDEDMQTNLHNNLSITENLSNWAYDTAALQDATRGFSHTEVFHRMDQPLHEMLGPPPQKCYAEDQSVTVHGRYPRWIFLKNQEFTEARTIIGELRGKIGHMNDYIRDGANRWDYLRHPAPFVFFHPRLPIYIDTRQEGTICRYLRRSCRPNLIMTTFLENESEYHFCFTAKEDIAPATELTIGWVPDEHIRKFGMGSGETTQDADAGGEEYISDWVSKVLPEFGGCACQSPEHCWLTTRMRSSSDTRSRAVWASQRPNSALSMDDDPPRTRPKPTSPSQSPQCSRTPVDNPQRGSEVKEPEMSDREKRKIAALERNFEQLDSDKINQALKKKKRSSSGLSGAIGVGASDRSLATHLNVDPELSYRDPTDSDPKLRSSSAGPVQSPLSESAGMIHGQDESARTSTGISERNTPTNSETSNLSKYVHVATQTIEIHQDSHKPDNRITPFTPIPYRSLSFKLLLRSNRDRRKIESMERSRYAARDGTAIKLHVRLDSRATNGTSWTPTDNTTLSKPDHNLLEAHGQLEMSNENEPVKLRNSPSINMVESPTIPDIDELSSAEVASKVDQNASPERSARKPYPPSLQSTLPPATIQASPIKKVSLSDYIKRKVSYPSDIKLQDPNLEG